MIYFTAHTFKCVCHCRRAMFRVLGMYNFDIPSEIYTATKSAISENSLLRAPNFLTLAINGGQVQLPKLSTKGRLVFIKSNNFTVDFSAKSYNSTSMAGPPCTVSFTAYNHKSNVKCSL